MRKPRTQAISCRKGRGCGGRSPQRRVVGEKPGARLSCARDGQRGARPHAGLDPGRRARAPVAAFRPLLPPTHVSRPRSVSVSHGSPCLRSWCLTPMASGPDTVSHGVRMSHGVLRGLYVYLACQIVQITCGRSTVFWEVIDGCRFPRLLGLRNWVCFPLLGLGPAFCLDLAKRMW